MIADRSAHDAPLTGNRPVIVPLFAEALATSRFRQGWTPCHGQLVTVDVDDLDDLNEVTCKACSARRLVSFVQLHPDWVALWWP